MASSRSRCPLDNIGLENLKARNILLTGASAGIGRQTAIALIRAGHQVWGTARSIERLTDIDGLRRLELDLSQDASIDRAMAQGEEESGGFDVVINNAGYGIWCPLETMSPEQERDQFQVMVFGPLRIIRGALPGMRERGQGLVINVTSLAAQFAVPFLGTYSACKAALASASWSLQMELKGSPIRIVDIQPGDILTQFHEIMERPKAAPGSPYKTNLRRAYSVYDRGMQVAPPPHRVAQLITKVVEKDGVGYCAPAVGGLFQARIAPLLARISPTAWFRWGTRRYYNLR